MADPVGWLPPVRSEEWDWEPGGRYYESGEGDSQAREAFPDPAGAAMDAHEAACPVCRDGGLCPVLRGMLFEEPAYRQVGR